MRTCPACHGLIQPDAAACPSCGHLLLPTTTDLGALISNRYEILEQLGVGGMGAIFRAHDRVLKEEVALKVMGGHLAGSEEAQRRFRSEIKLARRVAHRNVCRIYEYGELENLLFISMELVTGVDLGVVIKHRKRLSPAEGYSVARQFGAGIVAIHEAGILHRDLKPSNVMLDREGVVKLMDFGIAKRLRDESASPEKLTATGQVIGTVAYMSPEQAFGEDVDFRSDIYSFGMVLFELFTGTLPFQSRTPAAIIYELVHGPPPLDGTAALPIPEPLRPVLHRALAKKPGDRYQTVAAMVDDVRKASSETPGIEAVDLGALAREVLENRSRASKHETTDATFTQHTAEANQPEALSFSGGTVTERGAPSGEPNGLRRAAVAAVAGVALIAFMLLWYAGLRTGNGGGALESATSPGVSQELAVVRLNALPWARITIPAGDNDSRHCTTPCLVELPTGVFELNLENGGLTPPLAHTIRVESGAANEFVISMPGYDANMGLASWAAR